MKNRVFTELYVKYHRLVIKCVWDQTGDGQLAEEVCQQVFLKLYDRMEKIRLDFVKTWLLLTAKRLVIDYYRTSRVRNEIVVPTSRFNTVLDYTLENYVDKDAHEQLIFTIMDDLRRVNERWYQVIYLVDVEGMTQEEAGEELGISVGTLRARRYRAKQYIREKYYEKYKEEK